MNKIAIIGFSGSFPGANDTNALWELTSQQEVGIKPSNLEDINKNLPKDLVNQTGFRGVGGGPSDFKSFDASFFGYSPKEAQYLDPQIRKSLEYAWKSIEHAGYCPDSFKIPVGVYVASSLNSYFLENLQYIFLLSATPSPPIF
ncbi:beta-ketoacyl synthase N-terminal-like domain-containing protein [Rickettsia endosymbiont of Ixodes scapularis]|uniref:beta-ketoacyl synthase N-terminal-like domain-containing protein n=1 Tax=Rickettsia endosymbiont of Ixodes scapularis TaxID=444612 RepID=UPI00058D64D6|nr:beta-ketoacyl synthase N-terminal-like domain-containing protein [Rickettsia endosymbiont of Ixodes scapularis]